METKQAWTLVAFLKDEGGKCEQCGTELRHVCVLKHTTEGHELRVGSDCAAQMTKPNLPSDIAKARKAEDLVREAIESLFEDAFQQAQATGEGWEVVYRHNDGKETTNKPTGTYGIGLAYGWKQIGNKWEVEVAKVAIERFGALAKTLGTKMYNVANNI